MTSQNSRSLKVTDINPHLLCVLCGGYYIDATTIIECLHSFCRSCIVRYLETNKYCPICDVQVHKTKPLLNIRPDRNLQAIVYKLVPGLFQKELQNRKEFYTKQGNTGSDVELPENCPVYTAEESILLKVQYANNSTSKVHDTRYFRCPAAISVYHLQKLMRAKFDLSASQKVDFFYDGDSLPDYLSLMDLAYMYHWKKGYPVELEYRFLEYQKKKIKLSHDEKQPYLEQEKKVIYCKKDTNKSEQAANQPDREVQLQISENGVISVQSVSSNEAATKPSTALCPRSDNNNSISEESMPVKNILPENMELMKSLEKTVNLDFEESLIKKNDLSENKESNNRLVPRNNDAKPHESESSTENSDKETPINVAPEKSVKEEVSTNPATKSDVNHMSPLEKLETAVSLGTTFNTSTHAQKVYPGAVKETQTTSKLFKSKDSRTDMKEQDKNGKHTGEKEHTKPVNNVRYKTLKTTVKPWNPSIPRSSIMAMKQAQLVNQEKSDSQVKPISKSPKFFKMRNLPRFLGNPASGVKPMYQVLPGSELNNQVPQTSTSQNSKQNSELTVMKIDPKTLSPIPVTSTARSKMTTSSSKAMSGMSQKPSDGNIFSNRTPIHNPVSSVSSSRAPMKKTHPPRLPSSPFMLPPHTSHMLYSGFPRPFPSVDPTQSRMPSDNQIFRAMSMLCSPSGAFHPSLPPSISMLFNPHHPHHRSSQNEKMNMKFTSSDFHKSPSSTPSVQRVPPSCPTSKHSLVTPYGPSGATDSINNNQDSGTTKSNNEKHTKQKQEIKPSNSFHEEKSESGGHNQAQTRLTEMNSVPLSNGFATDLYKCTVDKSNCDKNKEDSNEKKVQNVDIINQTINKDVKNDHFGKSSVNKSSVVLL